MWAVKPSWNCGESNDCFRAQAAPTALGRGPVFADGGLRDSLRLKLTTQDVERRSLLGHVVVAVIVPRLNTGQAMRLEVASYFPTNAAGCKQYLDAGSDPLQLEPFDRVANDGMRSARQRSHADGLLAGSPIRLQIGPGERSLVSAIELRRSTRLRGWVEHDAE